MNIVLKNPYRILGLLVGATAREQERQTRRLKQFIEAEQEPEEDFSFPVLGQLNRTIENVNDASSKLNLGNDKIIAALFWFFDGSHTDEPAFDAIKANDTQDAIRIWGLKTSEKEVAEYNLSAFSNLSTLMLHAAFKNELINETVLEKGIRYKLKFIESNFSKSFIKLATDETFKISKIELQLLFLNQIQVEIEKSKGLTTSKFIEIVNQQEFSAKEDFLKSYIQKPLEQIEKEIETGKVNRKNNKTNSIAIGKKIISATAKNYALLKSILGSKNLKFINISDKIADEVLQCGIDYYNHFMDTDFDPGPEALTLCKKSKSFAFGKIVKNRCEETIEVIQDWVEGQQERDKQKMISVDFDIIKNLIDAYDNKSETVENAIQHLNASKKSLNNIKNVLGSSDELYLSVSTRIASDALNYSLSDYIDLKKKFETATYNSQKLAIINSLKEKITPVITVINMVGAMDLKNDFKTQFQEYKTFIQNEKTQLDKVSNGSRGNSGGGSSRPISTATTSNSSDFDFSENAWWIFGLIGVLIGAYLGDGGGALVGGIIGVSIGKNFSV